MAVAVAGRPWDVLDDNIAGLVEALNAFPGIRTVGSCGGHLLPGPTQHPAGEWFVSFDVAHGAAGRFALECLIWAVHEVASVDVVPVEIAGHKGEALHVRRAVWCQGLELLPFDIPLPPGASPPAWGAQRSRRWATWALSGHDGADPSPLAARLDALRVGEKVH